MVHSKTTDEWHMNNNIRVRKSYIQMASGWHTNDTRLYTSDVRMAYEWHRVHKRHTNDIRVHTSGIRVTYEYIRVTYGWHTSAYEWHTDDIQVTCKLLQLNPRKQEEHLTSQLSWAATWLLVTGVCSVYIVD